MLFAVALLVVALAAGDALAGAVEGTVRYDGAVPNLKPIKMDADPGCAKKHSSPVKPEVLVLGDGNTMANIFVHVKGGLPAKQHPTPSEPVTIDQRGCTYVPHVLGVMVGQKLEILNSDGLLHNVHALPKINKGFNRAMPANVSSADYTFDKPEFMFKIKCDVHPWMGAYVAVMEHPYFTVTGDDGKFKIANLPAGTYEIEAWHERLGTQTFSVTISGDETQTQEVVFSKP
jgi:plastocyanin